LGKKINGKKYNSIKGAKISKKEEKVVFMGLISN